MLLYTAKINQTDVGPEIMKHAVFIQTNHKQIVGAIVAEHALRRYSTHNDKFDVQIIDSNDYPFFAAKEGQEYLRDGAGARG